MELLQGNGSGRLLPLDAGHVCREFALASNADVLRAHEADWREPELLKIQAYHIFCRPPLAAANA